MRLERHRWRLPDRRRRRPIGRTGCRRASAMIAGRNGPCRSRAGRPRGRRRQAARRVPAERPPRPAGTRHAEAEADPDHGVPGRQARKISAGRARTGRQTACPRRCELHDQRAGVDFAADRPEAAHGLQTAAIPAGPEGVPRPRRLASARNGADRRSRRAKASLRSLALRSVGLGSNMNEQCGATKAVGGSIPGTYSVGGRRVSRSTDRARDSSLKDR